MPTNTTIPTTPGSTTPSFFQSPPLAPAPNLEPPGFDLLRSMLMQKIFQQEQSPYGQNPNMTPQQMQSLSAGNGRGMFNPYQGGYGGGAPGQQGPAPSMSNSLAGAIPQQGGQQGGPPLQSGGGAYGFDGYTLNGQITHLGDDGCMGHDGPMPMPGAGGGMAPPQPGGMGARPPMGGVNPQHAAALHAIMAAIMAKHRSAAMRRPGMAQRNPMMAAGQQGMPAPPMAGPRPMGMDGAWPAWAGPAPTLAAGTGSAQGSGGDFPFQHTQAPDAGSNPTFQSPYNIQNQWSGGWKPNTVPSGGFAQPGAPPGGVNGPGGYSTPLNWSPYQVATWMGGQGGVPGGSTNAAGGAGMAGAAPLGHDSPYHFQSGPMAPLGMDAITGAPPAEPQQPASTISPLPPAVAQIIGGGSTGGFAGGASMFPKRRPMGFDAKANPFIMKPPKEAKFVISGKGGRPHRAFDEPRTV